MFHDPEEDAAAQAAPTETAVSDALVVQPELAVPSGPLAQAYLPVPVTLPPAALGVRSEPIPPPPPDPMLLPPFPVDRGRSPWVTALASLAMGLLGPHRGGLGIGAGLLQAEAAHQAREQQQWLVNRQLAEFSQRERDRQYGQELTAHTQNYALWEREVARKQALVDHHLTALRSFLARGPSEREANQAIDQTIGTLQFEGVRITGDDARRIGLRYEPPDLTAQLWRQVDAIWKNPRNKEALDQGGAGLSVNVLVNGQPRAYPLDEAIAKSGYPALVGPDGKLMKVGDKPLTMKELAERGGQLAVIRARKKAEGFDVSAPAVQQAMLDELHTLDIKQTRELAKARHIEPTEEPGLALSGPGLDMAATNYAKTGQLPPMGMGKASTQARTRIINRAAALYPSIDLATNRASFAARQAALTQLQRQQAAVRAFEQTASKNIDIFLETAGKIVDTGSPLANRPARALTGAMLGSPDIAAYDAARQVALNEIARVTSNPNLTGVLSDQARREIEAFNPRGATLRQTVAVMRVLKRDMANRLASFDEELARLRQDLQGAPGGSDVNQSSPPTTAPRRVFEFGPDGRLREVTK